MKSLRFRTTHETHPGLRRGENEDSVAVHPSAPFWAVADGMGGHQHGRFASSTVAEALDRTALTGALAADLAAVERAIAAANGAVFARAKVEQATIGTTLAALYVNGNEGVCLWVGDSRVYRFRDGVLCLLTRDHTHVRHLIDTRQITEAEARNHPMGHVLTRAIGVDALPRVEQRRIDVQPDDIFLLCSDGLTACASDDEIAAAIRQAGAAKACGDLVQLCLRRGAPDNVSIVVVICDEVTAVSPERAGA
ncbi:MAG: serine/threonine-protein phosphatase [Alphaproteobacteria bacterium]|nr:serine/threonine-protein phosphatase [Alphaproteobacteria bacterium]